MSAKKGIIRHKSLYPLSHHHHHALFMALNLRRAGTEKSKRSAVEIKKELQDFWEPDGQEHFREEEEILLPAYAAHGSLDRPEISEMLIEHVKIRSLIYQITNMEEDYIPLMQELGQMLEAHIRKEERILFPMMEDAFPEEVLKKLAPLFHKKEG